MKLFPMVANNNIHEVSIGDEVVCIIGISQQQVVDTPLEEGFSYVQGGYHSLCFAFYTNYRGNKIQSDVRVLTTTEGVDKMRQEFEAKLPELKQRIDDEKNKPPTETKPMDSSTNP